MYKLALTAFAAASLLAMAPATASPRDHAGSGHDMRGHDMRGHKDHGMHGSKGRGAPARPMMHPTFGVQVMAYDRIRAALADDDLRGARKAAGGLAASTWRGRTGKLPQARAAVSAARSVQSARDIRAARAAFGELSRAMIGLVASSKAGGKGIVAYKCPMAKGYGKWMQAAGTKANPYMGKKMLKCGMSKPLAP